MNVIAATVIGATLLAAAAAAQAQSPNPGRMTEAADSLPPVPTAEEYLQLTLLQRYRLRIRVRYAPLEQRLAWLARFSAETLGPQPRDVVFRLHEEKEEMDRRFNTVEPPR